MYIIILALLLITVGLCIYSYSLYKQNQQVIQINTKAEAHNQYIEKVLSYNKERLEDIDKQINEQLKTQEQLRQGAQKQAQEYYDLELERLKGDYQEKKKQLDERHKEELSSKELEIAAAESQLADLQAKQNAYIEAIKRQEAIAANNDYYRLAIDSSAQSDIEMLRDIQHKFVRKESIDKLIWETYYKAAYDALVARVLEGTTKICGIYKITSLTTGAAYVGQSVDVRERWRQHIKTSLTYGGGSNKLYQAMYKEGQENFTFELLEAVDRNKLNERESYWIDFYKTKEIGLNATKGNGM